MGNTVQRVREPADEYSKQEQHHEQEEASNFFTCEICIEPVPLSQKFNSRCSHPFCSNCIGKYIEAKIEDYNMSDMQCPGLDCNEHLDPLTCHSFLSKMVFQRWCDALCESTIQSYDKVYCPYSDCSSLILNECGGNITKTKCPNCKKLLCLKCGVPWHAGSRCTDPRETRDANDVLLYEMLENRKWKRCPVCKHGVELLSGCSIVRCRCGTRFCHACGRKCSVHWCWCRRSLLDRNLNLLIYAFIIMVVFFFFVYVTVSTVIGQKE